MIRNLQEYNEQLALGAEDDELEELTQEEVDEALDEWILEGILVGALPMPADMEFAHCCEKGLECGILIHTENGVQLSRDVAIANETALQLSQEFGLGLELAQEPAQNGIEFGVTDMVKSAGKAARDFAVGPARQTIKRVSAKTIGRAKTAMREGAKQVAEVANTPMKMTAGGASLIGGAGYISGRSQGARAERKRFTATNNPLIDGAKARGGK